GITVTTEWVTATGAAVTVRFSSAVMVTASQPSYTRGQTVSLAARVTSGGGPVANATVNFTITKTTGAVIAASVKTGKNGGATSSLKLKPQDPVGTYQAAAAVKALGNATTTFTVK